METRRGIIGIGSTPVSEKLIGFGPRPHILWSTHVKVSYPRGLLGEGQVMHNLYILIVDFMIVDS